MDLGEARRLLDVHVDASAEEIDRAYRRKVFLVHPDRNPSDPSAADRVQQLTQARQIAKDAIGSLAPPLVEIPGWPPPRDRYRADDPFWWVGAPPVYSPPPIDPQPFADLFTEIGRRANSPASRTALNDIFEILNRVSDQTRRSDGPDPIAIMVKGLLGVLTAILNKR